MVICVEKLVFLTEIFSHLVSSRLTLRLRLLYEVVPYGTFVLRVVVECLYSLLMFCFFEMIIHTFRS
jgi:hypothetical protein